LPARAALTGVVLCGGRSVRMGRDKSLLEIGGRTLLEHAIAVLDGIAAEVLLACGPAERYADLGRPLVVDAFSDGGPLAGLEAGLRRASTVWIAALAIDMPRAEPSIFGALLERAERDGLDVCFLRTVRGVEPLCAVYKRTCLEPMRAALDEGERKVVSFLRFDPRLRASEVELEASLAINLNTPAEFQAEARQPRTWA
jgi:molybdopterin-guanine dinucleotide biosynthesis protein A